MKTMKAIIIYPNNPEVGEIEIDVPIAPVDDPSRYEPESLYPAILNIPGQYRACNKIHLVRYDRKGFRMHDDGQIAVYHFVDVTN